MATISEKDLESLQRQLAEARENLRIIQERKAEFVLSVEIPLQLVKEERSLLDKIAELEQQLAVEHIAESAPSAVTSLHQLPPPPGDFTGREAELAELHAALASSSGAAICGLRGLGGIGKTALALKLAERLAGDYPDAQFFLDLKGTDPRPLTAAEAMGHVVRAYHPTLKLPDSQAELTGLYLSVLHGQRALLVMDNAAGREQVEPLIPPAGCRLLVTSRRHFTLPGLVARNLDTLPPDDAQALLLRIAARIGDKCAGEIARLCGCLPLALRLAGSALAEREDLSPADYLCRLADAQTRLELVDASLSLSYNLLGAELQERWRMLAVFPGTFDRGAAAAVWKLGPDPMQNALSELVRFSLVEWDETTERYRLHDLARLFADAHLDPIERGLSQGRHAAHYETLVRAANQLYLQGGEALQRGLALFDLEWSNVQAGQAWAAEHSERDEAAAQLCGAYPDAGVYCLALRQHPHEQIDWLEAAVTAARRLRDRRGEGSRLGNLANAYGTLGQTDQSIVCSEQALAIHREIGDRRGEGTALGNLGIAYANLGQVGRAIDYYQQALAIDREIGDRRGEGNRLGNLGNAYFFQGQAERAIAHFRQALDISREIGDRRGEGNRLGNLGNAYFTLGQVNSAIEYYQQALTIAREIGDRHGEGASLGNIGSIYASLGQAEQAIGYFQQALALHREIGDRRDQGSDLCNLGSAYAAVGQVGLAIEYLEQALTISREVGDRRGEGSSLGNLGNAYAGLGRVEQAHECLEQALTIFEEIKSPHHAQWARDRLAELAQA
jgi:tetratricopeptide (TPR) repeat protein